MLLIRIIKWVAKITLEELRIKWNVVKVYKVTISPKINTLLTDLLIYKNLDAAIEFVATTANSFPDYMTPAVRLRLVYHVRLSGNEKDQIKKLKDEINATKSPDIDTAYQTGDPLLLAMNK